MGATRRRKESRRSEKRQLADGQKAKAFQLQHSVHFLPNYRVYGLTCSVQYKSNHPAISSCRLVFMNNEILKRLMTIVLGELNSLGPLITPSFHFQMKKTSCNSRRRSSRFVVVYTQN